MERTSASSRISIRSRSLPPYLPTAQKSHLLAGPALILVYLCFQWTRSETCDSTTRPHLSTKRRHLRPTGSRLYTPPPRARDNVAESSLPILTARGFGRSR